MPEEEKRNDNSTMQEIKYLQQDMIELQIAYTHQQEHIQILDQVILELRSEIHALHKKLQMVEDKINTVSETATPFDLQEEKPPHY